MSDFRTSQNIYIRSRLLILPWVCLFVCLFVCLLLTILIISVGQSHPTINHQIITTISG